MNDRLFIPVSYGIGFVIATASINISMDRFQSLRQQCNLLVRASSTLRLISTLVREGAYDEARELQDYYKSELEPLLNVMNPVKRN